MALHRTLVVLALLVGAGAIVLDATATWTPPVPTSCGDVGFASDPPANGFHIYWGSGKKLPVVEDPCPATFPVFSGDYGFGVGGDVLFSRVGSNGAGEGSGVVACFPLLADAHHGADTTIHAFDDAIGGAVGFSVATDWARPVWMGGPGNTPPNACGDGMFEPCPPDFFLLACNPLDTLTPVPTIMCGSTPCILPASRTWTTSGGATLADIAGANGAVYVITMAPWVTTGEVWTS